MRIGRLGVTLDGLGHRVVAGGARGAAACRAGAGPCPRPRQAGRAAAGAHVQERGGGDDGEDDEDEKDLHARIDTRAARKRNPVDEWLRSARHAARDLESADERPRADDPHLPRRAGHLPRRSCASGAGSTSRALEHIPAEGPLLIVGNHDSYWDPVVIGLAAIKRRQIRALSKSSLWKVKGLNKVLDGMGQIPIMRGTGDAGALDRAIAELRAGSCIGIFPEGTRSLGRTLRPRSGLGRLVAAVPEAVVVPVAVTGTTDITRFPKRPRLHVRFLRARRRGCARASRRPTTRCGSSRRSASSPRSRSPGASAASSPRSPPADVISRRPAG